MKTGTTSHVQHVTTMTTSRQLIISAAAAASAMQQCDDMMCTCMMDANNTTRSLMNEYTHTQGDHSSWKVMEFSKTIFQAGKLWKTAKVMESHGK